MCSVGTKLEEFINHQLDANSYTKYPFGDCALKNPTYTININLISISFALIDGKFTFGNCPMEDLNSFVFFIHIFHLKIIQLIQVFLHF